MLEGTVDDIPRKFSGPADHTYMYVQCYVTMVTFIQWKYTAFSQIGSDLLCDTSCILWLLGKSGHSYDPIATGSKIQSNSNRRS